MSEETHGYLRGLRSQAQSQLGAFRDGRLGVWDNSVSPRIDVSQEFIDRLAVQLTEIERLMEKHGVASNA